MSEPYRFLNTYVQNAAMNMAIDESILTHHLKDEVPPTLRVFRWSQPSISVGRFQSIEREIVSEVCLERGVALVRRPTGGRAVYHRDEFTYSIVINKHFGVPSGVVAAYAFLSQGLLAALTYLGVQAELSDERVSKHPSAACFASSTQADLTSKGFKLIGSAQVWKDNTLLQQGSLPLDDCSAEFFTMLRFPNEAAMNVALALYREKTTPLHTFASNVTWDAVADAFIKGFSTALQVDFVHDTLTHSEWELAKRLVEEKYNKLEWRKQRVSLAESL
jgi:lipoyl(octanoyl) transferase